MLGELPSLDSALSQYARPPISGGLGGPCFLSLPLSGFPFPPLKSPCCAWNRPLPPKSSEQPGKEWCLSGQPSATCLPPLGAVLPELSWASYALAWRPGVCLGCCQSRRLCFPLYLVAQPSVPCSCLERSAAEQPACWRAGLQPPRCLSHGHFPLFCRVRTLESQAGSRLGRQQAAGGGYTAPAEALRTWICSLSRRQAVPRLHSVLPAVPSSPQRC